MQSEEEKELVAQFVKQDEAPLNVLLFIAD